MPASSRVPAGAGREQRSGGGGGLAEVSGEKKQASGREASPTVAAVPVGFWCRTPACCGASRPGRGASVAGRRPPRRVAVSSSTSGAPAAGGKGRGKRVPLSRPASGAGQPRPADAARSGRAPARLSPPSRARRGGQRVRCRAAQRSVEKAAQRSRLLARGVAGGGRPPGPVPRRPSGDGAAGPAPVARASVVGGLRRPVPSLPCRHRRVRDAAPAGRSGERAGAVRVGRARRRAGRRRRARARRGWRLPG